MPLFDMTAVEKVQNILKKFAPLDKWKSKNMVNGELFILLHQGGKFTLIRKSLEFVHLDGCIGGYNAHVYEAVFLLKRANLISEAEETDFLGWLEEEDRKFKRDSKVKEIERLAHELGYRLVKVG